MVKYIGHGTLIIQMSGMRDWAATDEVLRFVNQA